jgi:hypothetical protein
MACDLNQAAVPLTTAVINGVFLLLAARLQAKPTMGQANQHKRRRGKRQHRRRRATHRTRQPPRVLVDNRVPTVGMLHGGGWPAGRKMGVPSMVRTGRGTLRRIWSSFAGRRRG